MRTPFSTEPPHALPEAEIRRLEANADRLLDEIGIEVGDPPLAVEVWRGHRVRLNGNRLHMPCGLAREIVEKHARPVFTQLGRDTPQDVLFGRGSLIAAPAYAPPYVDFGAGRHLGSVADFERILTLTEHCAQLRHAGGLVGDLGGMPVAIRHLHYAALALKTCSKPLLGPAPNGAAYRDTAELLQIGLERKPDASAVNVLNLVNSNPPMRYRTGQFRALVQAAKLDQGLQLTAYLVPGLTAPVTLAGAMTQGLAELLFGAATAYLVNPKAKILAGIIPAPFSMSSMRPTYGQPMSLWSATLGAHMIRRLGLPCRIDGGPTSAKLSDAQSGYEAGAGLWMAVHAQADFILHAAGWLDNGLLFSEAKFRDDVACLAQVMGNKTGSAEPTQIDPKRAAEIDTYVRIRSEEIRTKPDLAAAYAAVE